MADKLTDAQREAVLNRGGNVLVSAAAGSGKTRVLVERLLSYLTDPESPADLDEFLIITYTKAAAMELRGKIATQLTKAIAENPENRHLQRQLQRLFLTQISTVHGFCSAVLKEYAYRIDLPPDFRVADETESAALRQQVLQTLLEQSYSQLEGNESFRIFVDSQGVGRNDNTIVDIVQKVYDSARCHPQPEKWLEKCSRQGTLDENADASQTDWGRYLMDDLFCWLDIQMDALRQCATRLEKADAPKKALANINDTIAQLEHLRRSETWDQVYERKNVNFGRLCLPELEADPSLSDQVKAVREACKKKLKNRLERFANPSAQVMADLHACAQATEGLLWLVERFGEEYSRVKRARHILDFSDLEHAMLDLLQGKHRTGPTAAAAELSSRFREVMVDEYQDSNGVQDAIFSALTGQKQNCFMVGDVKQSIYRFRLADPHIFLKKYGEYAPAADAAPHQGRKILLSDNFRSGPEVISAVNDVFSLCMTPQVGGLVYGKQEALQEGREHEKLGAGATELYVLDVTDGESYEKEADFTAGRIQEMLRSNLPIRGDDGMRPVTEEDIVILLRSPGTMAEAFRNALERRNIRCALDGGSSLMDTAEVSTLCALLQTIANPRQDISLLAVLASPVFGFTADDLACIRSGATQGSIYDALRAGDHPKAAEFLSILAQLREEARLEPPTVLLQSCFSLTRLDSIFSAMSGGKAKRENLQRFFQMAVDYEKTGARTLPQFLEHLQQLGSSQVATDRSNAGCVTIMSIHKSKGLEFPVVMLCGLSHRFNASDQYEPVLCDQELGLGLSVADNRKRLRYAAISKQAIAASIKRESISEELRILYVAMTRAQDRLIMTCAMKNPAEKLSQLSSRLFGNGAEIISMEANCHADWVLCAALQRMEAGELHAVAGRPETLSISKYPWSIHLVEAREPTAASAAETATAPAPFPEDAAQALRRGLAFRYDHLPATLAPSKQTATGRKGRTRDEEAWEDVPAQPEQRFWRHPATRQDAQRAAAHGSAVHSAMQFIRYEACRDLAGVTDELRRMQETGLLTAQQAASIQPEQIAAFFETSIGRKLCDGAEHIREFKFSILDQGENYGEGLEGEQILLQGVVDCALLEADGITVLDFKTDRITEQTLPQAVQHHRIQLETYAEALSRIFERPVRHKFLYFFHLGRLAEV